MRFILMQIVITVVLIMALSYSAFAEIYVWEDETGSHAASDPKDVPPEVLKSYGKSPSNEEKNAPRMSEPITTDTNDKSLSVQSKEHSERLAIKLDSYKLFLSTNPALKDVATKLDEIEGLFSLIGNTCIQMGDAKTHKMQGEYVKAAEVEICNDRRHTLAPFVANTIERQRVSGLNIDKMREFPTRKMDTDRPKKLGGRVISRAVGKQIKTCLALIFR